jgi:poly-beta-1,6 N-acetyl-D-glucosamine synthase
LTVLVLAVLCVALALQGYARHEIGRAATSSSTNSPSAHLAVSGAVLDLRSSTPRAAPAPDRTVALTFDDGPDPRWTPALLNVLARHHAKATFFVVGSRVLAHPSLLRRVRADGNEIGVHTFTHVDMSTVSSWERNLQLSLTETAVAGAAGVHPVLFRPPYSSTPAAVTTRDYAVYREIAQRGYLIALADFDSRDWQRDGVDAIVGRATPPGMAGGIILFHDGGGDRSETVDAVDQLLTSLQSRGYRFVTVSDLAGLAPGAVEPSAGRIERLQGLLLEATMGAGRLIFDAMVIVLPVLGLLALIRAALVAWFARRHNRRVQVSPFDPNFAPTVSVVVPAYNEQVGIARAVRSLAASDYPTVEVIVVDDGSTDDTAAVVASLALPNVRVISQPNQGKPAALNTGIAAADSELVVMVDGDTVFERDALRMLVQPFADPHVGAVAGNTKVANRRGLLGRWQHIEYVMGFNLDRRMFEQLRCMPTVPGAIGAFRRAALNTVGGVHADTLAEDTDLTMAVGRAGWLVVYEPRARAWTEAPATMKSLWKQRYRWSYGTMQAIWKHRSALRRSARSPLGSRALPYMCVFHVLLPLLAPVIDLFAIYGLVFLEPIPVLGVWLAFTSIQLLLALYAFRLDHERPSALAAMPLQQIVYRQLLYLVVLHSAVTALVGAPFRWQKLDRTGDFSAAPSAESRALPADTSRAPLSPHERSVQTREKPV